MNKITILSDFGMTELDSFEMENTNGGIGPVAVGIVMIGVAAVSYIAGFIAGRRSKKDN